MVMPPDRYIFRKKISSEFYQPDWLSDQYFELNEEKYPTPNQIMQGLLEEVEFHIRELKK